MCFNAPASWACPCPVAVLLSWMEALSAASERLSPATCSSTEPPTRSDDDDNGPPAGEE
jgi:hypothetical protein